MNIEELTSKCLEIFNKSYSDTEPVKSDTNWFESVEFFDSMERLEYICDVERELNVHIPDEELEKFNTVDDVAKYLKENVYGG